LIPPEIKVRKIVASGRLVPTIRHEATAVGSSLLLVGAHYADRKRHRPWSLSTALELMSSLARPVAVLDTSMSPKLFSTRPKLLLADDLGLESEKALRFAVDLSATVSDVEFTHLHVNGIREDALKAALDVAAATSHTPVNPKTSSSQVFANLIV